MWRAFSNRMAGVGSRALTVGTAWALAVAFAPEAPAQEISVAGTWSVTMATSVRRTSDGNLEVLKEIEAHLSLRGAESGISGTLSGDADDLGAFTTHLEGSFRDGRLDLDPIGTEGPEVSEGFVGFYVNGVLADGGFSGEMWSAVLRDGEERHLGPLPWSGRRDPGEREAR